MLRGSFTWQCQGTGFIRNGLKGGSLVRAPSTWKQQGTGFVKRFIYKAISRRRLKKKGGGCLQRAVVRDATPAICRLQIHTKIKWHFQRYDSHLHFCMRYLLLHLQNKSLIHAEISNPANNSHRSASPHEEVEGKVLHLTKSLTSTTPVHTVFPILILMLENYMCY